MTPLQKRFIMFLLGCIPVRLSFVVLAQTVPLFVLKGFAVLAACIAIGFWAIFLGGWRKVGLETQGALIWWNALRPVHGTLWLLIAYYSWTSNREVVWRLLLVDVCIGLITFMIYHGFIHSCVG